MATDIKCHKRVLGPGCGSSRLGGLTHSKVQLLLEGDSTVSEGVLLGRVSYTLLALLLHTAVKAPYYRHRDKTAMWALTAVSVSFSACHSPSLSLIPSGQAYPALQSPATLKCLRHPLHLDSPWLLSKATTHLTPATTPSLGIIRPFQAGLCWLFGPASRPCRRL